MKYKAVSAENLTVEQPAPGNPNDFIFHAIANTARVDMDDEVVVPEGADTTYIESNRSIFYDHNKSLPIGRLVGYEFKRSVGAWWTRVHITDKTQFARDVRGLIQDGIITGVSIGFDPIDYGRPSPDEVKRHGDHTSIIRRWKWLELSVTAFRANLDAKIELIEKSLRDDRIARTTVAALGLPVPSKRVQVAVPERKKLVVRPLTIASVRV